MWTMLNDEGKKVWGDVFPDGKVPVASMIFQEMKDFNLIIIKLVLKV